MSYYFISRNKFSLFCNVLKCTFVFMSLVFVTSCSSTNDYEIFAKIQGHVTDYQTGEPLQNASVTLSPLGLSKQTDSNGFYQFEGLDAQQYTVTVQKLDYQPNRKTVTAISGEIQQVDIQLTIIPKK
ncbi:MAG: carboxypeptidase regulatory-like domain-containing protein [Prevotellaceae bacterium]|nr:carboxypeptidase regulatory-like domain-containing protein [Prevotellaceae bacterium]